MGFGLNTDIVVACVLLMLVHFHIHLRVTIQSQKETFAIAILAIHRVPVVSHFLIFVDQYPDFMRVRSHARPNLANRAKPRHYRIFRKSAKV